MLTDALGSMANVNVIDLKEIAPDKWQPLWIDVDGRGLGALDSAQELTGAKTHFVRINFVDGQYELETRQLDGQSGSVSPWRRERTADRAFVARLAGKLIAEDFGLIGTIAGRGASAGEGESAVSVKFKGAGLGGQLGRWVKPGDVFALYKAAPTRAGGKVLAQRETDALVRITDDPKNGEALAKLYYRSKDNPLSKSSANLGFRCVRLGASSGPMRLRLVRDDGQAHTGTLQVRVHSQAFQEGVSADEEILNPDRGGLFTSRRNYDQIAFARIVTGATVIARVPVPIQEGREFVARVGLDPQKEEAGRLQAVRAELNRFYDEAVFVQKDSYDDIKKLVTAQKNQDALKRARNVRRSLDDDLRRLGEEKDKVRPELAKANLDLAYCDKVEKDLEKHKDMLNRIIGQLEELDRLENAPDKQEQKVKVQAALNKARVQLDSDDYDGALKTFNDLLAQYPNETGIKKQRDELQAKWELHGNEHAKARQYVYETWSTMKTTADIEKELKTARLMMSLLQNVKDTLTLIKLYNSLSKIGKIIKDEFAALAQSGDDADKKAKLQKLADDFDKFQSEVEAAVKAKSGG
jgi:hypothetical protein